MPRSIATLLLLLCSIVTAHATEPLRRGGGRMVDDPHKLVSAEALLDVLAELVSVRAFEGYRTAASPGEREALEIVRDKLERLPHLQSLGLEIEVQDFHMPFGIEPHASRLWLSLDGVEYEVPVSATAGLGRSLGRSSRFDSDGEVGDLDPDPHVASGPVMMLTTTEQILDLDPSTVTAQVLIIDPEAISISSTQNYDTVRLRLDARRHLATLQPAAFVFVTSFSDVMDQTDGIGIPSAPIAAYADASLPPRMVLRLEDLSHLGLNTWQDLSTVEQVRVLWDADVVCPGRSGNLVVTIPGRDRGANVILGAHLDSSNTPGALDDGSGVASLVEVARVIDRAQVTPPVDLVLAFFGAEEWYLFGSAHFATSHEELLDRSLAMLEVDCLTSPREGVPRALSLAGIVPDVLGGEQLPWADYLGSLTQRLDIWPRAVVGWLESDNGSFQGFAVPNSNLIFWDADTGGGPHFGGHLHSPYDDLPMAEREIDTLVEMTHVALAAALRTGIDQPTLSTFPSADIRILMVASHTEAPHMSPAGFRELGTTLAAEGIDIDVVAYGEALTAADLNGAAAVITMPVFDYALPQVDADAYDESWSENELDLLQAYVDGGGLLLLTHARGQMTWGNWVIASLTSEDGEDDNSLAARFDMSFDLDGTPLENFEATVVGDHALVAGIDQVYLGQDSGRAVLHSGQTLLQSSDGRPVMASTAVGGEGGEVIILGDLSVLADNNSFWPIDHNTELWLSLARYVRER